MKRTIAAGGLALIALAPTLSACGDSETKDFHPASSQNAAASGSSASTPKAASKADNGQTSKPVHGNWTRVFGNDDNTRWRCAGTTLLIEVSADGRSGITSVPSYPDCIDAAHPQAQPTVG